eukprot:CAMPEP_0117026618 /NCGR_PEP_ID=MMETSP0472-20121206/19548_1 /TAXON_ID=693140 ORGANISM="Tiarina fusus, Strain LIS" /NCGR_SAMPLE_ID=MMETSP0472 /ASSEMBLY_ACC=CAM_ASM_000603 /LENGTH=1167 /DNA_ID=CAMNT_0004733667 /DNA_START=76 /DNA_END=3579 /DNA_ORIENTATION=-
MGKTVVWVKADVLAEAFGKGPPKSAKKNQLNLDRGGGKWAWSRCTLDSGDLSALDGGIGVTVYDDASEFNGQSSTIAGGVAKPDASGSPKVVMANDFTAADVNGEDGGTMPDDLITLTHLHEPSVIYCLRKRYKEDQVYTATGPILIALNPFKRLPGLYDDIMMNDHWMAGEKVANLSLKPHIFQNAHAAFRAMMQGIEMQQTGIQDAISDQSMLVSGESGAGKTVTTKFVMKYLASLSQRKADFAKRRRDASPGRSEPTGPRRSSMRASRAMSWKAGALVEERILQSNPILEAFGNARTVRNDNSSRFGKFIELQFKQTGSLVGAKIETYLLEKVRLVNQSEGERNYHIFYELLSAATDDEREDLMLGEWKAQDFKMTNMSGTFDRRDGADDVGPFDRRDGADDEELYDELAMAMGTMGFDPRIQEDIFGCTAAFLHAFNLTFLAPTDESSRVDESNPHLEPTLKLLGLSKDAFNAAMTEYEIEIGNQSFTKQLTVEGAQKAIEAFIKGTYGAMFSYIVSTVNKKIDYKPAKGAPRLQGKAASISVLDIFGFESFQLNSFEQLCINYCNEALQQQFNLFVFKNEQEEYKKEGINWDFVSFPDNSEVLELIDKKGIGILPLLTDQCRAPRTNDQTFVAAMYKTCGKHERFVDSALHKGKGQFIINHYAGLVMYDATGFLEKNKDETPRGASALLESSTKEFIQMLGKITTGEGAAAPTKTSGRSKKRPTVGSQFSAQLTDLRRRIDNTKPHYIRCLKPNQSLKPDDFEPAMVADQLRYAGVLEAIRVSRVGYSQRYAHSSFLERYRFIAAQAVLNAPEDKKMELLVDEIAKKIWEDVHPGEAPPSDVNARVGIQKGSTKIFMRQHAFETAERLRTLRLTASTVILQAAARRFVYRCRYIATVKRIILGQASGRRFLARKYLKLIKGSRVATKIQAMVRRVMARIKFLKMKAAACMLQKTYRGFSARKKYKALYEKTMEERRIHNAATAIQCMARSHAARTAYQGLKKTVRPSRKYTELEGKAFKEAIKADRAAAVAKATAKEREKEVETLNNNLATAKISSDKAKLAMDELKDTKLWLSAAEDELATLRKEVASARESMAKLKKENEELKAKLESGVFVSGKPYDSKMYHEYPDLEALDQQMFGCLARSKQSKDDVKALIGALALLK